MTALLRRLGFSLAVVLMLLLWLLVLAPASWLSLALHGSPLALRGLEGRWWSGSAEQVSWQGVVIPGGLRWRLGWSSPTSLGLTTLGAVQIRAHIGWGRWRVDQLQAQVPAAVVAQWWPSVKTWQPQGVLRLHQAQLRSGQSWQGELELLWLEAKFRGQKTSARYQIRLSSQGGPWQGQWRTLSGSPDISASGNADSGTWRWQGQVALAPQDPNRAWLEALVPALVGREQAPWQWP